MKISRTRCMLLALALAVAGCHRAAQPGVNPNQVSFPVKGKVISTDASTGQVMLDAAAIPGFMDAMAMPYKLAQPETIGELHPGDRITGTIHAVKDEGGFHDARLGEIVIVDQAQPDYKPAVQYHVPAAGDIVPDFKLLNQDGRMIHLAQFKGKALLITFIYTRCPLADFCPRMSQNFAQIDHALAADPKIDAKTQLLSISFDPVYDTPAVLRAYGTEYAGQDGKASFAHWQFAAPSKDELPAITQFFNVGVTPGENGTLMHSLSTLLIGKDGRIAGWYPSNEWQPQDMTQAMKDAAVK